MQRVLTSVTLLGLLVATAAAFAITEHLKLKKSALYAVQVSAGQLHRAQPVVFSPVCGAKCKTSVARIQFKLRHPDRVKLTIVDSDGHKVATRGDDQLLGAHSPQHLVWDGRSDTGQVVPDGVYYPWVSLGHGHTFEFSKEIHVDTQPPHVISATPLKRVLLAGPGRSLAIAYHLSEKAHPLVYLDGRLIILGRKTEGDKIKWNGRRGGRQLREGKYVLSIGAKDVAGNETPVDRRMPVPVILRYVELTPGRISVRSGGRIIVHVTTAARRYQWRLGQRNGERRGRVLRLSAPSTPGTYRLVVSENGHSKTVVVKVHPK